MTLRGVVYNSETNSLSNENKGSVDALTVLNEIKIKSVENMVIGHLNISSLPNKYDTLSFTVKDKLDLLVIGETKLDKYH